MRECVPLGQTESVAEAQEEADTVTDESGVTDDEPVLVPVVEKLVVPAELGADATLIGAALSAF